VLPAELRQLRAVFIVHICNYGSRRIRSTTFKQLSLGRKIFVHAFVIVEMVAREVGKHRHIERHSVDALLRQRVR
jgi:hypothetical protein